MPERGYQIGARITLKLAPDNLHTLNVLTQSANHHQVPISYSLSYGVHKIPAVPPKCHT